jgi:hypothetical protein
MTKLKKLKVSLSASIGIIVLVALIGVGLSVKAFYGNSAVTTVIEDAGGVTINNATTPTDGGESLGATASPDVPYNYMRIGGITKYYIIGAMKTATTTLCSFVNPFGAATSTLESFDYEITTGTSTAATLVVNASTGAYASSTATNIVSAQTVASGATDSMSWMSAATADLGEVSPNEYILLQTEGAGLSGYTFTGRCQAVFRGMPR